jgi:hypothetical protein
MVRKMERHKHTKTNTMKKSKLLLGVALLSMSTAFSQKTQESLPFKTEEEKLLWIREHPNEYRRMNGEEVKPLEHPMEFRSDAEKSAYLKENGLGKEITILEDIPDFPRYIDTGNPETDLIDYANRKDQWVEQNQKLYDRLTQSSENNLTREERLQKGEIIIRN